MSEMARSTSIPRKELRSVEGWGQIALAAVNIVKITPTLCWILESAEQNVPPPNSFSDFILGW